MQLMRSRYAAYALCLPDYIIETTHPANPQFSEETAEWAEQIALFSARTQFKDLKILAFEDEGAWATVLFVAHLFQDKKNVSFTEKSCFEKVKGRWLYRSGQVAPGA